MSILIQSQRDYRKLCPIMFQNNRITAKERHQVQTCQANPFPTSAGANTFRNVCFSSSDLEVDSINIQICVMWLFMAFLYVCTLSFARVTYHFSALLKCRYMCVMELCYCLSTEYQRHTGRSVAGYDADLSGHISSSGFWYEGIRLTFSHVWMKMCIFSIPVHGLLSRMAQLWRKCWCLTALTSNSHWGFTNWMVGLWLKVRLLFLYLFS